MTITRIPQSGMPRGHCQHVGGTSHSNQNDMRQEEVQDSNMI